VPGATVAASLSPAHGHFGLAVALSASSTHSQSVGSLTGAAHWSRMALVVGPQYRLGRSATMLDFHAGGAIALLHVEGDGLPSTTSDTSAQFWCRSRAARPLGLEQRGGLDWPGLLAYPGHDYLEIGGLGDRGELPHLEVQIAFGLSLGRFP